MNLELHLHRARPCGSKQAPAGRIIIEDIIPENGSDKMVDDAKALYDVLSRTVPAGMLDALLIVLLEHKRSTLVHARC